MPNGNAIPPNSFAVTADELIEVCQDTLNMFAERDEVINIHAEAIALHRFIFEKFFPKAQLEAAAAEYYKMRQSQIAEEESKETDASQAN